jgi:hypothetical protein
MPTDLELQEMKVVGARVEQLAEGWKTTIIREDKNGFEHEETFPLRARKQLAWDDVLRADPDMLEYAIVRAVQE